MSLEIAAIRFNHDPNDKSHSGLNLRRNATEPVPVPEWRRGRSRFAADSPVAYALEEVGGGTISLEVELIRTDRRLQSVEVRAVESPSAAAPAWIRLLPHPDRVLRQIPVFLNYYQVAAFLQYSAFYQMLLSMLDTPSNVLGEVASRQVSFGPADSTGPQKFTLKNVRLASRGVGVSDIAWLWQFRAAPGDPWRDLQTTRHRVFTVVALPTAPWSDQPQPGDGTALPWTETLEFACRWATGARSRDDAARRITESVFALGGRLLEYSCPIGTLESYSISILDLFNLTAFLRRLRGGVGQGRYVNCSDCASIVSTFANSLGCDLWQSRMGVYNPSFQTNPILAIGTSVFQSPCGWGTGFTYHEVAWKGACTANDEVFDACLALDADATPFAPPHVPLLPVNMRFGESGDGQYRDIFAQPGDRDLCAPRPQERTRRTVF